MRPLSWGVRLADREGVSGLSMRRLAGALGAGAMSLYHYVASVDSLPGENPIMQNPAC